MCLCYIKNDMCVALYRVAVLFSTGISEAKNTDVLS